MPNPVLRNVSFSRSDATHGRMTLQGTIVKTFFLLFIAIGTASWVWYSILKQKDFNLAVTYLKGAGIGGFIASLVTIFFPKWSPITAPIYAGLQGAFLGAISLIANTLYPGIVLQALPLTFSLLFCMLFLYTSGIIKPTKKLYMLISMSLGALLITTFLELFLNYFFHIQLGILHGSSWLSIGVSIFLVVIGALSLITDFEFIRVSCHVGQPRYMEWYASFSLLVSLLWLYFQILQLLIKLQDRKKR